MLGRLIVCVLCLSVAGCGQGLATSDPVATGTDHPAAASAQPLRASDPTLDRILNGITPGFILRASVGDPPLLADPKDNQSWLSFDLRTPSSDPVATIRAQWQASLVAGAYRQLTREGTVLAEGYSIRNYLPNGNVAEQDEGGDIRFPDQLYDTVADISRQQAHDEISRAVEDSGMQLVSFEVESPLQIAPVVIVQTTDAQTVVDDGVDLGAIFGDPFRYEGVYVEIIDSAGSPVAICGVASRMQQSICWQDPKLTNGS
jgi:hypothetical protein